MKKIYFFFSLMLACILAIPAYATDIVTEFGSPITDMASLSAGDKILFYCNGPTDPSSNEYGTRNAFLREGDENRLYLSRDIRLGNINSADYIWTILSYEQIDETSYSISLKSPRGNYLPTFIDDIDTYGQWSRWMGKTISPEEGEPGIFSLTISGSADSLFYIFDENGVYFNGQNIPKDQTTGSANFVGWNSTGDNSLYRIYKPTIEEKNTYTITMVLEDENGEKEEDSNVIVNGLMGDTIQAPTWEHHDFVKALDYDNEVEVKFPYVIDGSEPYLVLTYSTWPYVTLICRDEATEEIIYSVEDYYKKGSYLNLPTQEQVGLGYSLVTEGYDHFEITEDTMIELVYRRDGKGVPFKTTTVENGVFAENTPWYMLTIRDNKTLAYDEISLGVNCGPVEEITDANLWAFTGDMNNGYKIYNKQAGAEQILWSADGADATQLFMTPEADATEPNTFDLSVNGNGFAFKLHNTSNSYINDFANAGVLKYWSDNASATDGGSKFTFKQYTAELADAMKFGQYISYLQAENCVGGWTAEQLADLKKAYTDKDTAACAAAVEALAAADTIAFDINKKYALVSAFQGLILDQPGKTYAMAVEGNDSLVWKPLDETNEAFHFVFRTASDTTRYIISYPKNQPIAGFRFNGHAKTTVWGELPNEDGSCDEGVPAPFWTTKSQNAPAAYNFVHVYLPSKISLCAFPKSDSKATEGYISTYNNYAPNFNNYWRMKIIGEWDGINTTEIAAPGAQQQVIYDLSGRRVNKAVKGLYIVNGKKVYVK